MECIQRRFIPHDHDEYSHSSIFSKVKLGINAERYNYSEEFTYNKIVPSLTLILKENNLRSKKESNINVNYISFICSIIRNYCNICSKTCCSS